jgi:bifunctional enzyme CysN/CysC
MARIGNVEHAPAEWDPVRRQGHEPARESAALAGDISAYLKQHEAKDLLRFVACGSVDDGKSTLIGRLLYESKVLFEDQLAELEADSKRVGARGEDIDFSLLVDGLAAEREQRITIDVAYRFFSTDRRKFIVADTPGHEQYTRNMITGASSAELAVILIDARKGMLTQTRRHSYLVSLIGIRDVVLAVNKMDLVGYSREVYERILGEYAAFAAQLAIEKVVAIPMSAIAGDNIAELSGKTPWHRGPTLMEHLETVRISHRGRDSPFRLPVQWVNRPHLDFRGFSGLIAGGTVRPGDLIKIMPSARQSRVARVLMDGDLPYATTGQSVTITLEDDVDCSRGDIICGADRPAEVSDQFQVIMVWMNEQPMLPGRTYLIKIATAVASVQITTLKHKVNVNTLERTVSRQLDLNEIGVCNISLDRAVAFDPYDDNRDTGGFIVIDRLSNETVGAGLIHFSLHRAQNIHWQVLDIDRHTRASQKSQSAAVVWFTGLSGSGKSTIANLVERKLFALGKHTCILDGDNIRHGLNRDLGFTDHDRVENIRRVAEVAKLMADAGLIVLVSLISPFRSERRMARDLLPAGAFFEVFVDTPFVEAERRDPKGLYRKARGGAMKNFTGIDSPYEPPEQAEIHIETMSISAEQAAEQIVAQLDGHGILRGNTSIDSTSIR